MGRISKQEKQRRLQNEAKVEAKVEEMRRELGDLRAELGDQVARFKRLAIEKLTDAAEVYGDPYRNKRYHFALGMAVGYAREIARTERVKL